VCVYPLLLLLFVHLLPCWSPSSRFQKVFGVSGPQEAFNTTQIVLMNSPEREREKRGVLDLRNFAVISPVMKRVSVTWSSFFRNAQWYWRNGSDASLQTSCSAQGSLRWECLIWLPVVLPGITSASKSLTAQGAVIRFFFIIHNLFMRWVNKRKLLTCWIATLFIGRRRHYWNVCREFSQRPVIKEEFFVRGIRCLPSMDWESKSAVCNW
jgi:hypothetical protein